MATKKRYSFDKGSVERIAAAVKRTERQQRASVGAVTMSSVPNRGGGHRVLICKLDGQLDGNGSVQATIWKVTPQGIEATTKHVTVYDRGFLPAGKHLSSGNTVKAEEIDALLVVTQSKECPA